MIKPTVAYKQKDGKTIEIPFIDIAYYFVEWSLFGKDDRKEKIEALMRANKLGLGEGVRCGRGAYKTYEPEEGKEDYGNVDIETLFSNAYILASLPEGVLPFGQRHLDGDKNWNQSFRDVKRTNIDKQIENIRWEALPDPYNNDLWFNKDNTLVAFGLGTKEQQDAHKQKRKEVGDKNKKRKEEKKKELNEFDCALGKKCRHEGGAKAAGPRIVDPRCTKKKKDVYHMTCVPFYCQCTKSSWNKNETCRSIDGVFKGKECSYGVYGVLDSNTGTGVTVTSEPTVKKLETLVNIKCVFIKRCMCGLNDGCNCKKGGYLSELWVDNRSGVRIQDCKPESLKYMVSGKCKFIVCMCGLKDKCRCTKTLNGKKGGYLSELWVHKVSGIQVENCKPESLATMMNGKCKFIVCMCGRKKNGGCRCTVVRGVLGLKKRGGWASGMWFDRRTEKQVSSFDKETLKTIMSGKCLERECDGPCKRSGFASWINKPSPFTKGKFFCNRCAEYDVFDDEEGCGICGGRLYVCKSSVKFMKGEIERYGLKKYEDAFVQAPVTLKRDAHERCFTTLRNRMINRKEEEDLQKRVTKFEGDVDKNLDVLNEEMEKLIEELDKFTRDEEL